MDTGVMVVTGAAAVLVGCTLVGGPMVLADWVRTRRQAAIARQIALTDALDAQFGTLFTPVVTKPLFGPWEVRIAVPLLGSAVLARILGVTDAVFAGVAGKPPVRYRMDLRVTPTSCRAVPDGRASRSAKRCAGTPVAAA
jgi:hypothetical protein